MSQTASDDYLILYPALSHTKHVTVFSISLATCTTNRFTSSLRSTGYFFTIHFSPTTAISSFIIHARPFHLILSFYTVSGHSPLQQVTHWHLSHSKNLPFLQLSIACSLQQLYLSFHPTITIYLWTITLFIKSLPCLLPSTFSTQFISPKYTLVLFSHFHSHSTTTLY